MSNVKVIADYPIESLSRQYFSFQQPYHTYTISMDCLLDIGCEMILKSIVSEVKSSYRLSSLCP